MTNNDGAYIYEKVSKEGKTLGIRTAGTGTTSANTPLLAVGNTKYNGKNPPKYLNAEFNWFKVKIGDGDWVTVNKCSTLQVPKDTPVSAIASVGNLQEATWLTPEKCKDKPGAVYLVSTGESGLQFKIAIETNTAWNKDTEFGGSFILTNGISKETKVEIQMNAEGRAWFGEKLRFTLSTKGTND